jgi:hypothetical protein
VGAGRCRFDRAPDRLAGGVALTCAAGRTGEAEASTGAGGTSGQGTLGELCCWLLIARLRQVSTGAGAPTRLAAAASMNAAAGAAVMALAAVGAAAREASQHTASTSAAPSAPASTVAAVTAGGSAAGCSGAAPTAEVSCETSPLPLLLMHPAAITKSCRARGRAAGSRLFGDGQIPPNRWEAGARLAHAPTWSAESPPSGAARFCVLSQAPQGLWLPATPGPLGPALRVAAGLGGEARRPTAMLQGVLDAKKDVRLRVGPATAPISTRRTKENSCADEAK